jgi:hypothetical protein
MGALGASRTVWGSAVSTSDPTNSRPMSTRCWSQHKYVAERLDQCAPTREPQGPVSTQTSQLLRSEQSKGVPEL